MTCPPPHRLRRTAAAVLAVVATAALAGCGDDPRETAVKIDDEWREISTRPPIDVALAEHERLLTRLRAALTAEGGVTSWRQIEDQVVSGCGEAIINYGVSENGGSTTWGADPVPDDRWPAVQGTLVREAAAAGFTTVEVVVDRPRDHTIVIHGRYGARLDAGTGTKGFAVYIQSGCHPIPGATKPVPTPEA